MYKEIFVIRFKALFRHSLEGFHENDKMRVNQMPHSMEETATLLPRAAQLNIQNNLPGEVGDREREKKTIWILRFFTVVTLGTHVFREVTLCS